MADGPEIGKDRLEQGLLEKGHPQRPAGAVLFPDGAGDQDHVAVAPLLESLVKIGHQLEEEGVERIEGPHCYAFYTGLADFDALAEADPTCFYLTDYLVRHFDRLIIQGLGIDRHPELLADYFGNYTTLVYLAQTEDPALQTQAEAAAAGRRSIGPWRN